MKITDNSLVIYIIVASLWMLFIEIRLRLLSRQWREFNNVDYSDLTKRLTRK